MSAVPEAVAADPQVRGTGIGSSDAAAACGVSKWRTPLELYYEKVGLVDREPAGEAAAWGTILEPVLLRQLAIRERVHVVGRDEEQAPVVWNPAGRREPAAESTAELLGTLRHPDHDWQLAHLDAVLLDDNGDRLGFAEAKTAGFWAGRDWGEEETDNVPLEYLVQINHAAAILRALGIPSTCRVPVLLGGQRWKLFRIEPDAQVMALLTQREADFWKRVINRDPPPATGHDLDTLKRLYPTDHGREIEADAQLRDLALALKHQREVKKQVEQDAAAVEATIKESMGDASALVGDGWKITWKQTKDRTATDWKAAFHEAVATLDDEARTQLMLAHTTTKPGARVFRPSLAKLEA